MKTHRMYRKGREETPNILVLKPGVEYVTLKVLHRYIGGDLLADGEGALVKPSNPEQAEAYYTDKMWMSHD